MFLAAVQHERGPRNSTLRRQVAMYLKESSDIQTMAAINNHQHFFRPPMFIPNSLPPGIPPGIQPGIPPGMPPVLPIGYAGRLPGAFPLGMQRSFNNDHHHVTPRPPPHLISEYSSLPRRSPSLERRAPPSVSPVDGDTKIPGGIVHPTPKVNTYIQAANYCDN